MHLRQERNRQFFFRKIPPTVRAWLFGIMLLAAVLLMASIGDSGANEGTPGSERQALCLAIAADATLRCQRLPHTGLRPEAGESGMASAERPEAAGQCEAGQCRP